MFTLRNADMSVRQEGIKVENDLGYFFAGTLPVGTYYLEETAAPDGYTAGKWFTITVGADSTTSATAASDARPSRTQKVVTTESKAGASGSAPTTPVTPSTPSVNLSPGATLPHIELNSVSVRGNSDREWESLSDEAGNSFVALRYTRDFVRTPYPAV